MRNIRAWAAFSSGAAVSRIDYKPGVLGNDEIEIEVEHCGLCHSDVAIIDSDWSPSQYPIVPGHEIIGRVIAVGDSVRAIRLGQRVGIGWYAESCGCCSYCVGGEQQLCDHRTPTIVGRFGGLADYVRAHWMWAIPIPESLNTRDAAPLLCGGLTVFFPFWLHGISPISRVAIVGIGGLGHLALQFARAWGCEVTAITSSAAKAEDAKAFGAHHVKVLDESLLSTSAMSFDLILITASEFVETHRLIDLLKPKGRLHHVGIATSPSQYRIRPHLISRQRSISGSSNGSPRAAALMLEFAARHHILPRVERFPMSRINDALERLREGDVHYRIIMDADFS